MKKVQKLKAFDITSHLDSEEAMAEYLSQVLEGGNNDELVRALGHIAKAKGMATVANDSGLAVKVSTKHCQRGQSRGNPPVVFP
jgi:probable addiction module antidote protein